MTPTGRVVKMKKVLLYALALLPLAAQAGKITMSNPDEQELKGGKKLCTYENRIYLFTLVTRSQTCPHSKTFETSENEK
nr:hypothetical protein EATA8330_29400 [Enterobacter asburiae]